MAETITPQVGDSVICMKVMAHPRNAIGRLTSELVDAHAGEPIVGKILEQLGSQVRLRLLPVLSRINPEEVYVANSDLQHVDNQGKKIDGEQKARTGTLCSKIC